MSDREDEARVNGVAHTADPCGGCIDMQYGLPASFCRSHICGKAKPVLCRCGKPVHYLSDVVCGGYPACSAPTEPRSLSVQHAMEHMETLEGVVLSPWYMGLRDILNAVRRGGVPECGAVDCRKPAECEDYCERHRHWDE